MWLMLLVSFTVTELPPMPLDRFANGEACQVAAAKLNEATKDDKVMRPEGSVVVCFRMVAPT